MTEIGIVTKTESAITDLTAKGGCLYATVAAYAI